MYWQNAAYLWGTLLAAVPVVIHLLKRRPQKPKTIPSLMWLAVQPAKNRRLKRWSDLLVLLFRMLAIVLVFVALAGPQFAGREVVRVMVQNEPSLWDKRHLWLPQAFDQLPELEQVELYGLQGLIGTFSPSEAREVAMALPPSTQWSNVSWGQSYTLTAGFLSVDTAAGKVIAPDRPLMSNAYLEWLSGAQVLRVAGDTIGINGQLIQNKMSLHWPLFKPLDVLAFRGDSVQVQLSGDSITWDNAFSFENQKQPPLLVVYRDENDAKVRQLDQMPLAEARWLSYALGEDSLLYHLKGVSTVVLVGFDFIPEAVSSADVVLQFPSNAQANVPTSAVRPSLEHPFYSEFFLGASMRERWPSPAMVVGPLAVDEVLLQHVQGPVAGMGRAASGQWQYKQAFAPSDWSHPYYKALLQWARKRAVKVNELPRSLGTDQWEHNRELLSAQGRWIQSVWRERSNVFALEPHFWTTERILLLGALLAALLALIFAKI